MQLEIVLYGQTSEVVIGEMPADQARDLLVNPFDFYKTGTPEEPSWQKTGNFYHKSGLLLNSDVETLTVDIHWKGKKVMSDHEIPRNQIRIRDVELDFPLKDDYSGILGGSVKKGVIYFIFNEAPLDYDISRLVFYADRLKGHGLLIHQVDYDGEHSYQEEISSNDHMIEPVFFH